MLELNEYEAVMKEFLTWFNPMRSNQLYRILRKCFPELDAEKAKEAMLAYQAKGYVLISRDGWAITKQKYIQITKDTKLSGIDYTSEVRIGNISKYIDRYCDMKLIHCLWVLIDMLPDGRDFVLTSKPFQITFMAHGYLYQVIYIAEVEEDLRIAMLKEMPNDYYEETKKYIRRIALMENEEHYWKVPEHIGFKYIVALDDSPAHIKKIKTFKEHW